MHEYELIVIGAGPGGYVAAIKAAQLGKRVAIIEANQMGGTCLNHGCIPTKTLVHTIQLLQELTHSAALGLTISGLSYDLPAMHRRKEEVCAQLRQGIEALVRANRITQIQGHAQITAPGRVEANGEIYIARRILIATGASPVLPPIPGLSLPGVMTSTELLENQVPLRRLTILGGGVIGTELATIYAALGTEVTILEGASRLLPLFDRELSQSLLQLLKKQGVIVHTGVHVTEVTQEDGLCCHFSAKGEDKTVTADVVLVAAGRKANTEGLFAKDISLTDSTGHIPVNESFETRLPGIYAIGDVITGSMKLAHVASAQGIAAVCAMYGHPVPIQMETVPACIYTNPEVATVGLSADEAKKQGIPVKTGKFLMSANCRTGIEGGERGFIKLVAHQETDVLLGAQLMCYRATDLVGEFSLAIANELTLAQMGRAIRPHPTFEEGIGEAIEDALGHAIHMMPRK